MLLSVSFGSFSAGHGHETSWSNPMQMAGQVECKWLVKSMQLPKMAWLSGDCLLDEGASQLFVKLAGLGQAGFQLVAEGR